MAVCPDRSAEVPFYVVKAGFAADFPEKPHWAKYQLSSMNRDHLVNMYKDVGLEEELWSSYIQELRVPCKTPKDILGTTGFSAEQIDLLQVDAEGYDGKILHAFLRLRNFAPQIIIFEDVHLTPPEMPFLSVELKRRSYKLYHNLKGNTLAIKPSLVVKEPKNRGH
eukprot:gnl/MRDRNA2_/MRDRNA2_150989_c0_seq1.p1 gnl/MRDRNA2_/MRDRNA2_150989_c0~~gnl/MRDRNA2_/MRDRNA2_150989_c0_seq1.p1  ORF type:complete len:184 (+),score=32.73 gnl/MRDRNA2_/MRDRNA2_150989_c0_seq1:55-552(+)